MDFFWIFLLAIGLFAEWMWRRRDRQRNDQRFANVIGTLNRAEREFNELKRLAARVTELEKAVAAQAPAATQIPPPAAAVRGGAEKESAGETPALQNEGAPASKIPPAPGIPPAAPIPPRAPVPQPPSQPNSQLPAQPHSQPSFREHAAQASWAGGVSSAAPKPRAMDIEQTLGTNWLNKIGIAVLVIGVALFLAYKFPTLNNPEKVGLGYFVSLAILGLGVFLERKDVYKIFARALIGGGWALVFFTTYAMYFVTYTRVIDTEWIDLVLLFAVAWAMVVHTLHYNSQVVTGLAFLLGFTTVAISENTVYCLAAGAILAFGLVAIVHKRSWFELEIFGLVASYVNHYVWLRSVIEPMGGARHMFPEFLPSAALLCTYWALYRWSYIARKIQRDAQEHVSTAAALLNTGLLLFLFKYQSVRPELAFYALLALGAIELTLGQLPVTRKRRAAMVILSTIGIVLLVAAVPFKYSSMGTAVLWLAQAETLLIAGVLTRETLFRRFSFLAAVLTVGDMLLYGAAPVLVTRSSEPDMLHSVPEMRLAAGFLFAGLLFLADAEWVPRQWKEAVQSEFEAICFRALSYLGGFAAFVGLWLAFPNLWTAVAWAGAAVTLAIAGRAAKAKDLSHQTNWLALAGFCAALFVNVDAASGDFPASNFYGGLDNSPLSRLFDAFTPGGYLRVTPSTFHFTWPFITIVLVAACLYLCAYFSGPEGSRAARVFSAIHTWAAMILLLALTLQETAFPWIPVVWASFGLLLMIAGVRLRRAEFVFQALLVSALSAVLALTVNLFAAQPFWLIPSVTLRLVTMSLTAALLYFSALWAKRTESSASTIMAGGYTWSASVLVWMLLLYELASLNVAFGWVVFGLALFECGVYFKSLNLRLQGYLAFASSMARVFLVNVNAPRHDLVVTTLPLAIAFYYVHWRAEMKREDSLADDQRMFAGPLLSYFGTVTVATVLYCALDERWVSTGWAFMALLLIAMAWAAQHELLLHHSLLLAGAVLIRTIFFDLPLPAINGVGVIDYQPLYVGTAAALLFACMAFAFPLRQRMAKAGRANESALPMIRRPEQVFFFVPLAMVTALIARQVSEGRVTMAWGIEAVIVFLFALIVGERSFRLTGLGLLLLCVGKILALDVWRQDKSDRFATFIILGVALLLVSFLYTRYSETIRRYL